MESLLQPHKHFVLVHGACHGAWCWFKVKPLLEAKGHKVTALDLSASGINSDQINDIRTVYDYNSPLIELLNSIPSNDDNNKVVLVGHSFGGLNIALAMEQFPHKILAAVFLSAFMPDSDHVPSYVLQKYQEQTSTEAWLDTQFYPNQGVKPFTVMYFGEKFLSLKLYQRSSAQDLELAKMLIRPSSLFIEDLSKAKKLTEERYGSIKKVYIVCEQDEAIPEEFQRWLIENGKVREIMEIKGADHMPMISRPQEVCHCLLNVLQYNSR